MKIGIDETTFAGVVLHATDGHLASSSVDYETSAEMTVTADVDTDGRAIVSSRLLAEIAKSLPNKPVTLETNDTLFHVRCRTSKFRLLTMPLDEFPALPSATTELRTITGHALEHAISHVAVAVSRDETLTFLTASWSRPRPGSSLSRDPIGTTSPSATSRGTGPSRRRSSSAARSCPRRRSSSRATCTSRRTATGRSASLTGPTTQLVVGDYPSVRRLFPEAVAVKAVVNVADLAAAVKRVALVADRGILVRLVFADDTASEALDATIDGDPLGGKATTLAFNPQYLADALGALDAKHVQFGANHEAKPVVLLPVDLTGRPSRGTATSSSQSAPTCDTKTPQESVRSAHE